MVAGRGSRSRADGSIDPPMRRSANSGKASFFLRHAVAGANAAVAQVGRADLATMLWSHHWPEQHDRCAVVGRKLVCRRCLVLYPLTFAVLMVSMVGLRRQFALDTFALIALPVPAVADFVAEHMGLVRYSPRRQMLTTAFAAVALGRSLARYLAHKSDPLFWTVVIVYAGLCVLSAIGREIRLARSRRRLAEVEIDNDPLVTGFDSRESFVEYLEAAASAGPDSATMKALTDAGVHGDRQL